MHVYGATRTRTRARARTDERTHAHALARTYTQSHAQSHARARARNGRVCRCMTTKSSARAGHFKSAAWTLPSMLQRATTTAQPLPRGPQTTPLLRWERKSSACEITRNNNTRFPFSRLQGRGRDNTHLASLLLRLVPYIAVRFLHFRPHFFA